MLANKSPFRALYRHNFLGSGACFNDLTPPLLIQITINMNWKNLTTPQQLEEILEISKSTPVLIFKHSTRCSISSMAKYRLEGDWNFSAEQIVPYYLDLITYRNISNQIAEDFDVYHESPQVLLIKDGECTYENSHLDITVEEIGEQILVKG